MQLKYARFHFPKTTVCKVSFSQNNMTFISRVLLINVLIFLIDVIMPSKGRSLFNVESDLDIHTVEIDKFYTWVYDKQPTYYSKTTV